MVRLCHFQANGRIRVMIGFGFKLSYGLSNGVLPGHGVIITLRSKDHKPRHWILITLNLQRPPRYDQHSGPDDRTRPDRQKIVQRWNSQVRNAV